MASFLLEKGFQAQLVQVRREDARALLFYMPGADPHSQTRSGQTPAEVAKSKVQFDLDLQCLHAAARLLLSWRMFDRRSKHPQSRMPLKSLPKKKANAATQQFHGHSGCSGATTRRPNECQTTTLTSTVPWTRLCCPFFRLEAGSVQSLGCDVLSGV